MSSPDDVTRADAGRTSSTVIPSTRTATSLLPARVDFQQVFLAVSGAARRWTDAERLLAQLRRKVRGRSAVTGDATLLPPGMQSATPQDIDNTQPEFADAIMTAPPGNGPARSHRAMAYIS
jgi:hypothetical protein